MTELHVSSQPKMLRLILGLALPNILSNITVPLLQLSDTTMAGHLVGAESLATVAVASSVVSFIYWLFGFLRMGTTGLVSQAYGRGNRAVITEQLRLGLLLAFVVGLLLIVLRTLAYSGGLALLSSQTELSAPLRSYLSILMLSAPAALGLYVTNGWLIGMQNSLYPMLVAIVSNVVNILLSYLFAFGLSMGVDGLAWGTVVAQYFGLLLSLFFIRLKFGSLLHAMRLWTPVRIEELSRLFKLSLPLFLRTLMLGAVTLYFVRAGSSYGVVQLSANALLMQLFTLFSYFMDGFAYAGEALTGRYIGAEKPLLLRQMLGQLFSLSFGVTLIVTLLYYLVGGSLLALFTNDSLVVQQATASLYWVLLIPISSFVAFLWDGFFVGATASRSMMQAMFFAFATFFGVYLLLRASLGVEALWLAFISYLVVRSGVSSYLALSRLNTIHLQSSSK